LAAAFSDVSKLVFFSASCYTEINLKADLSIDGIRKNLQAGGGRKVIMPD